MLFRSFNAGVVYGMQKAAVAHEEIGSFTKEQWDRIIKCGLDFSAHACTLVDNYVEQEWADNYKAL